jgi:glycosyltransferase involved in cell wall biosynthesis
MAKPRLDIVIPCLNEEKTIKRSVLDALKYGKLYDLKTKVIVADNGSTDSTLQILKEIPGVKILNVKVRGYGAALHFGILSSKADYVLFADADLSYPFSNLKKMSKLLESNPDMVLGSRLNGQIEQGAMPLLNRHLGTPVLTFLIRTFYGLPSSDCNSGQRIIKTSFYKTLNMRNSGMEWASELIIKTALHKGKYIETPINFKKDKRDRPPHLSRWSDGWRHLKSIILLKPILFVYSFFLFFVLSLLTKSNSYVLSVMFSLCGVVALLSYSALRFLEYAIEKKHNYISTILGSNRLVSWVIMLIFSICGLIWLLPASRLGTKLLLVSINALLLIWVFLIETIKTHLINRLEG